MLFRTHLEEFRSAEASSKNAEITRSKPEAMNILLLQYEQAESRILTLYLVSQLIGKIVCYFGWAGRQFRAIFGFELGQC